MAFALLSLVVVLAAFALLLGYTIRTGMYNSDSGSDISIRSLDDSEHVIQVQDNRLIVFDTVQVGE